MRKSVVFLIQVDALTMQVDALTMQVDALTMQADALTMQADVLTMQADALTMQADALTIDLLYESKALTLNPSPKHGRGTLNLAPLLPKLGEGVGG